METQECIRQALAIKRRLRLQGWRFDYVGLEPTGRYSESIVTAPNELVLGHMHSKTIIELDQHHFFDNVQYALQ